MGTKSFSDKMVSLTNDKTTTLTPSLLEVIAPLFSMLYFSGAGGDIGGLLGGGKKGSPFSAPMGAMSSMFGMLPGGAGLSSMFSGLSGMTPDQLSKILSMITASGGAI